MNMNDSERELCRSNYEAQMNMLGYNADGTPKEKKERHGEWIGPECSLCHAILERPIKYNYCPFCGADMT